MTTKKDNALTRLVWQTLAVLTAFILVIANVSTASAAVPPTNDDFLTPKKITTNPFSATITDMTGATADGADPALSCESGGGTGDATLWYTFTLAKSGEVKINTSNSGYDTVLAVFMDDPWAPGSLLELGCNNDATASAKTSSLTLPLRGGIKYYIEVARDSSDTPTPPDALRLSYVFYPKKVALGLPAGSIWNGNASVFSFSSGWQDIPTLGAYRSDLRISNNVNNTATLYFDGEYFDLNYYYGPNMGDLQVYVDDQLQVTLAENAGTSFKGVWTSPSYSDQLHKLTLKHGVGATKVNFDSITIYSATDLIPPGEITDLVAKTSTTSGGRVLLKWTAPGDDDYVGTAKYYEVRYFPYPIPTDCPTDWATGGSIVSGLPAPRIAGTVQQATISGLVPGFHYDFCIAAWDEFGNMGNPSNMDDAVASAGGTAYGKGTYDDKHLGWKYIGKWILISDSDARNKTLHISRKLGNSAIFRFTGNQFVFAYRTSPLGGQLDVYIDEVYYTTIDQNTPFTSSRYFTSPILPDSGGVPPIPPLPGPHAVRFVHSGGIQVNVDQIYINTTTDLGAPDPISDLMVAGGPMTGSVDLSWTAVGDDPSAFGFPPGDDTAVRYEIRYSTAGPITTEDQWYKATPAGGVIPAPSPDGTPETVTILGLTSGESYWFAVRVFDDAFYSSLSNSTSGMASSADIVLGPGTYDETTRALVFDGAWTLDANEGAGNGAQNILSPGTTAFFHFNGDGFTLTFQQNADLGKLEVWVDGALVDVIDQYSADPAWQQTYTLGGLGAGDHVVEFRAVEKATIDMITVLP